MKRYLKIIVGVHGALLLGVLCAFIILEQDTWFKMKLEHTLKESFSEIIHAPFLCTIKKINLLGGEVFFENIKAEDPQGNWSFSCPLMSVQFSWFSFLIHSLFSTTITFYQPSVVSEIQGAALAINEPFMALVNAPSSIPLKLKQCIVHKASLKAYEKETLREITVLFSSTTSNREAAVSTNFVCADGLATQKGVPYAQKISGTCTLDIPDAQPCNIGVKFHLAADIPCLDLAQQRVTCFGTYKDNHGSGEFYHNDHLMHTKVITMEYRNGKWDFDIQAQGTLSVFAQFFSLEPALQQAGGEGTFSGHIAYKEGDLHYSGTCFAENILYKEMPIKKCTIIVQGDAAQAQGSVELGEAYTVSCNGSWSYKFAEKHFTGEFMLTQPIQLPCSLYIEQGRSQWDIDMKDTFLSTRYTLEVSHLQFGRHTFSGTGHLKGNVLSLKGKHASGTYALSGDSEQRKLTALQYKDHTGKRLIGLKRKEVLEGTVEYGLIKSFVRVLYGYELPGEGQVDVKGDYVSHLLTAHVTFKNSNIRVPYTYNIVKGAQAEVKVDFAHNVALIKDLIVYLHKGRVRSLCSTLAFSQEGELMYAHVPLTLFNCFVSWQKDFFGLLSGALTATYNKNGASACKGYVMLEKSTFRSNLLSSQVQRDFVGGTVRSLTSYKKDVHLDVALNTRNPLEVKTPFLETKAHVRGMLKGTLFSPELSGVIELSEGSLGFPYKPLYITGGKIHLMPHQLDDPSIELHAKNKVKKYTVGLHVSGSLQQPKVSFDSSPSLQEEQIITLLLSGSEEGSLYLVMPNMIMQNIESLLFGTAENSSKVQRYLKGMLKPLKGVRIIPTLSDKTAEGKGFQGALEIDINDRLRAKVQNNLNLSEDTQVEVEYSISDDVSIKATKDDKGTLSGEVEMRWKF